VSAFPDLTINQRKPDDKFIMVACDGIWDCLTNEDCCELINTKLTTINPGKDDLHKIVEQILDKILAPNTEDGIGTDNMTAILIRFN
jgi:serine/threonine protein phosphatase PrpC